MTPCDTKVLYDTEFEAQVACAKLSHYHEVEMEVYRCGRHYHLTHIDRRKRLGFGRPDKFRRCPHCKLILSNKIWVVHRCKVKLT